MIFNKILVFHSKKNLRTEKAIDSIKEWGLDHDTAVDVFHLSEDRFSLEKEEMENFLAISIGGDGAFLGAADKIAESSTPLLGINVGSLGFLTFLRAEETYEGLNAVKEGRIKVRELLRLKCVVHCKGERARELSALNEISVTRREITGFTEVDIRIDGEKSGTYEGDGIIITTPTGSTAHSLACGGPIILPSTQAIGVIPMNAHQLNVRPFVCPEGSEIKVSPHSEAALLADGDFLQKVNSENELKITKSFLPTKILVPPEEGDFFSVLRSKLGWLENDNRKNT